MTIPETLTEREGGCKSFDFSTTLFLFVLILEEILG